MVVEHKLSMQTRQSIQCQIALFIRESSSITFEQLATSLGGFEFENEDETRALHAFLLDCRPKGVGLVVMGGGKVRGEEDNDDPGCVCVCVQTNLRGTVFLPLAPRHNKEAPFLCH